MNSDELKDKIHKTHVFNPGVGLTELTKKPVTGDLTVHLAKHDIVSEHYVNLKKLMCKIVKHDMQKCTFNTHSMSNYTSQSVALS